ncbi:hypothetical protein HD599_002984 [Conyzicola lurida]|uniref:Uncharacterized protein n=1 Tax=Conyzicola lurida TaxID=1172621 RepID=A0A841ASA1_9MICO|nr:hypothetical protein [Conyzicola lurida]MBB5844661.1 hypothetical protein [Conyzicola lurida]
MSGVTTHRIRFGGKQYVLHPSQDVPALKTRLAAAALLGGGFVDFATAGDLQLSLFMSPNIAVWFEESHSGD